MTLQSKLFARDSALDACSKSDSEHITHGATGDHVSKIQTALFLLDGVSVTSSELHNQMYGPSTAAAVLAFKKRRNIVAQADNIVGKMTIAAMDQEVALIEKQVLCLPDLNHNRACG